MAGIDPLNSRGISSGPTEEEAREIQQQRERAEQDRQEYERGFITGKVRSRVERFAERYGNKSRRFGR